MIYFNDQADDLSSNTKLFVDDSSLFSVTHDVETIIEFNDNLHQINKLAFQWRMNFNLDPSKQAQETIFSRKSKKSSHPF